MDNKRYQLFCELIDVFDRGCDLIEEYDTLLHDYNGVILFQAESQMIKVIGDHPGITASEISKMFHKTSSASSQLIRKLRKKEWVMQVRNSENNRVYNLYLTDEGAKIYKYHQQFENTCYRRTYHALDEFSEEELKLYIRIQKRMNETFQLDVEESQKIEEIKKKKRQNEEQHSKGEHEK